MENKTSKAHQRIHIAFVVIFFVLLCLPLSLMAIKGPDEYDQDVFQESDTKLIPLTLDTYKDGTFHTSFERWFSRYYPLRSNIVLFYNGTRYEIENSDPAIFTMTMLGSIGDVYRPNGAFDPSDIQVEMSEELLDLYLNPDNIYAEANRKQLETVPEEPTGYKGNHKVYVGKSGYLFESVYIDEYCGFTAPYTNVSREGVRQTVEKLEYIQTELDKRYGITMLYVLTPSKASLCSQYIPDHYKNRHSAAENYVRPVEMMREELKSSSINYLDSTDYYRQIGLLAVFPKTGIHWNHVASFETTAKLVQMYSDISGKSVKLPKATDIMSSPNPILTGNSDADIFNILYGANGRVSSQIMDDAYYSPRVTVENKDAPKINAFVQGGSFTADIAYCLDAHRVADVQRIYYNGTYIVDHWDKDANPWTTGIYAWEKILQEKDLIIFEQNEQQIRGEHIADGNWQDQEKHEIGSNAVYDSLYEYLKATE